MYKSKKLCAVSRMWAFRVELTNIGLYFQSKSNFSMDTINIGNYIYRIPKSVTSRSALSCNHIWTLIFPHFNETFEKLHNHSLTTLTFFIVYQLLEKFTLWRRRKTRGSPPRTHLYSSSSLSCRLWCCGRCAFFVGFALIQLPEKIHLRKNNDYGGEEKS